ncbi:MFS transporter [Polyangium aurulentum]|uniref:MFS transporter n=1 Tax=Polyangium aurulentum TaxID=2567896 RepID=UPI00197CE0CB|nr:MFS transporter [Polyangium aurulentum]UQA59874.1 MFS transporter [Polyangium aurulentum]
MATNHQISTSYDSGDPVAGVEGRPMDATGAPAVGARIGRYRWVIVALLFTAATINYVDRQILGVLKGTLQKELGFNEIDYGNIVTAFQAFYALGMVTMGRLMDRVGTKRGFSIAFSLWSLAAVAHAAVGGVFGLAGARAALGLGEAGMFPGSLKAISEWFPKKERSFATGVFNSGTNIGAIVCPLVVPWILSVWGDNVGWRAAFALTGGVGALWIIAWLWLFTPLATNERVTAEERAYIQAESPPPGPKVSLLRLIPHRQTWAFAAGKFMIDPFWWLYLFWVPDFLKRNHGVNVLQVGPPLVAIYLISDVGSIAGGWFSSNLMRRGWTANAARKTTMLICAICVSPILFATQTHSLWVAVLLIGLATAAHQGFSANLYTITTDMFPQQAVGSVVGFGGMAGAIGGMFIAQIAGRVLEYTKSYKSLFIMAASAYLLAVLTIHLLAPRLEPARLDDAGAKS